MASQLNRRRFIKIAGVASASILPVVNLLAEKTGASKSGLVQALDEDFKSDLDFYLLGNNLLNVHFYFLNVEKKASYLRPRKPGKKSFMVVRLPQQHVSERGFFETDSLDPKARLSGFSFLAFQLWPGRTGCKELRFDLVTLLNWNDQKNLQLITLIDWLRLMNLSAEGLQLVKRPDVTTAKRWDQEDADKWKDKVSADIILQKYGSVVRKLVDQSTHNRVVPVTLFEIPERLFLVPVCRTDDQSKTRSVFLKNKRSEQAKVRKREDVYERKYEIWNNTLAFERSRANSQTPDGTTKEKFTIETPVLRAVGFKWKDPLMFPNPGDCPDKKPDGSCPDCPEQLKDNFLPSLLDKAELAYLTQFAGAHQDPAFDIKELNGFFYTGLGVIAHLKYYNLDKMPNDTDLIEYEHIIHQGRDVFIKVSRLGYHCKTGQRYKHVIEGTRIIGLKNGPTSFIRLKQYCECIEQHIEYEDGAVGISVPFLSIDPNILDDVEKTADRKCHFRRSPFKSLDAVEEDRIPIVCLTNTLKKAAVENQCLPWFWPVKESYAYPEGTTPEGIKLESYLAPEFSAKDWEDQKITGSSPFMFLRASYVRAGNLTAAYQNYFKNSSTIDSDILRMRRRIYFPNKRIAYAAPSPGAPTNEVSPNKVNIVETQYIELSFRVRQLAPADRLATTRHVVFPQMLQARVFLDHIRDLAQARLPSQIEHHDAYVEHGFNEAKNYARQILQHTDAFVHSPGNLKFSLYKTDRLAIETALREAKDKLGNLVTPDIIPDTVSERCGITLPRTPHFVAVQKLRANGATEKIKLLDPRELLRGSFSEILGGIDLREILNEFLPENETPLFEINKILNRAADEVQGSQIYNEIVNFRIKDPEPPHPQMTPRELVDKYEGRLREGRAKVAAWEKTVRDAKQKALEYFPSADELKLLVKAFLEQRRLNALNTHDALLAFVATEAKALSAELARQQGELVGIVNDLKADLDRLKNDPLLKDFAKAVAADPVFAHIDALYKELLDFPNFEGSQKALVKRLANTVDQIELSVTYDGKPFDLYYDLDTFELFKAGGPQAAAPTIQRRLERVKVFDDPAAGLVQLLHKLEQIQKMVVKNTSLDRFQREAATQLKTRWDTYYKQSIDLETTIKASFQSRLEKHSDTIRTWLNQLENQFQDKADQWVKLSEDAKARVLRINTHLKKVLPFIDLVRRFDPYFWYMERKRIEGEVKDIARRFSDEFLRYYKEYLEASEDVQKAITSYQTLYRVYAEAARNYAINRTDDLRKKLDQQKIKLSAELNDRLYPLITTAVKNVAENAIKTLPGREVQQALADLEKKEVELLKEVTSLQKTLEYYETVVKKRVKELQDNIEERINDFLKRKETELRESVGAQNIAAIESAMQEARRIYQLLTSLKQQELTYTWNTDRFRDLNLGIVTFKKESGPNTRMKVDVKCTTHFAPGKFPPVVERVEVYSENRLTNFGLGFFNALTISFDKVSFIMGTGRETHFDVKIKDVQFDGALAFVQAFEKYLQTLGKGLILNITPNHVALGYSLPIPAIKTPGMSFFNLSLNFDFRLPFDKRPMRFGFSISRPESKFVIAVGIYAGFGYFSIVGEPKRGVVEISTALEAGAWSAISIGPIKGEVKLAFGFSYTKNDFGVRLEGYIVAEGRLSVWIIQVCARIYLGIISENSYVEGRCTVTYSAKVGFLKRSFSGTFHRKISGTKSNNSQDAGRALGGFIESLCRVRSVKSAADLAANVVQLAATTNDPEVETTSVSYKSWSRFVNAF